MIVGDRRRPARAPHAASTRAALVLAVLDISVQLLVVVLGLAVFFSPEVLTSGFDFARRAELARPRRSPSRSRCSPTRGSRRSRTSPRRRGSRARRSRDRCSPRSALVVVMTVLIAVVGVTAFPARGRLDRPRRRLAPGADRRDRDRVRGAPARRARRRPSRRRRALGSADPVRRRDDGDHRVHAPRPLDGRARHAAARVRPARTALARLARGAPGNRGDRDRDRGRDGRSSAGDDAAFLASPTPSACCSRSPPPSSP